MRRINIIKLKILSVAQREQLHNLWNEEYPLKLSNRFRLLLDGVENYNHYLIEDSEKNIIGWALDFEKENEIRFSIIISSKHKANGLGTLLVEKLKLENNEFYGWVIDHNLDLKQNGESYQSPLAFYKKQGFEVMPEFRLETDIIKAVKIKWTSMK